MNEQEVKFKQEIEKEIEGLSLKVRLIVLVNKIIAENGIIELTEEQKEKNWNLTYAEKRELRNFYKKKKDQKVTLDFEEEKNANDITFKDLFAERECRENQ